MRPIAKSAKRQVRSTKSSHIVNTAIRLSCNAVCKVGKIGKGAIVGKVGKLGKVGEKILHTGDTNSLNQCG